MDRVGVGYQTLPPPALALITPLHVGFSLLYPQDLPVLQQTILQRAQQVGGFQKWQVAYTPITPIPPVAYFYECSTCRFFNKSSTRQSHWDPSGTTGVQAAAPAPSTCRVVKGTIEPYGYCGLWLPTQGENSFTWLDYSTPVPAAPPRVTAFRGM